MTIQELKEMRRHEEEMAMRAGLEARERYAERYAAWVWLRDNKVGEHEGEGVYIWEGREMMAIPDWELMRMDFWPIVNEPQMVKMYYRIKMNQLK